MREYGLIGYPLDHSFSKKFFEKKFEKENMDDIKYHLFPISDIQRFPKILESHKNLYGFNVTAPYKELIIPYLDDLDPVALNIGAVNTVDILKEDSERVLKGYNTDVMGIEKLLEDISLPGQALIIGSGGASRAVRHVMKLKGVKCTTVSRDPQFDDQISYDEINKEIMQVNNLIFNCTPVGMYPKINKAPEIPYELITEDHICIDLIYNPEKTLFLNKCENKGAFIKNGFMVLKEQAERAWEIWQKSYKQAKMINSQAKRY